MRRIAPAAVILTFAIASVACGAGPTQGDGGTETRVSTSASQAGAEWWRVVRTLPDEIVLDHETLPVLEYGFVPLDILWDAAETVVRARVVAVDGPFWNQASGQVWEFTEDIPGFIPTPYRDVTVEIDTAFRGTHQAGEQVTLLVQGAGPDVGGGPWFEGANMSVGDDVVLLASLYPFRMREGEITVLTPIREPISVLGPVEGPDGSTLFVSQRWSGDGWPLLDDGSIRARYPDGIPEDALLGLTQEFDEFEPDKTVVDLFPFIYFPFGNEGGNP